MADCTTCYPGTTQPENVSPYQTPNYKLPLWRDTTVTSWLGDMNDAMSKIDTVMHRLELRTSIDGQVPPEAIEELANLSESVNTMKTTLENVSSDLLALQTTYTNQQAQITTLTAVTNNVQANYVNLDTRMETAESAIQNIQNAIQKLQENLTTLTERVNGYHPS